MNRKLITAILMAFMAIMVTSCVSGRKYKSLQGVSTQYMNERDAFKTENIDLTMNNKELEAKLATLEKESAVMTEEMAKATSDRDKAQDDYNKLLNKYTDLQTAQESLISGNVQETKKLLTELQKAQTDLQNKEDLLKQLEQNPWLEAESKYPVGTKASGKIRGFAVIPA